MSEEEEYYRKAQKIVKAKKNFRASAWAFATTMPILIVINLWTSPGYLWFLWALMGWGMGLIGGYYEAYIKPKYEREESHEVEKEMEKMRLRNRKFPRKDDFDEHLDLRELRKNYDERDFV